jgi:transposase InsO family protein
MTSLNDLTALQTLKLTPRLNLGFCRCGRRVSWEPDAFKMSCSESTIAIYPWQQFIKLSLTKNQVKPLVIQHKKKDYQRYERPTPGDRVQMDTCKIAPGIYQYTAVDDCSRYRVLSVFKRRSAANTLLFLDQVLEEMPFPIQRIQTDRGTEFFAEKVQLKMMEYGIKFRPNKPGSPHLNGKVERSQRTDKEEFYSTIKLDLHELQTKTLPEWQHYYNWQRAHGSFKGKHRWMLFVSISTKFQFGKM